MFIALYWPTFAAPIQNSMWQDFIVHKEGLLGEKAVVKDKDISVDEVLREMTRCDTIEDMLLLYPKLTKDEVLACISYSVRHFTIEP